MRLDGTFVCTMRLPLPEAADDFEDGLPVVSQKGMKRVAETIKPSLKYIKYRVCL